MKTRQIQEVLLFLLIIWFFYQGTIKMAHWNEYIGWVGQIRMFRQTYMIIGYLVPILEVGLSLLLLFPRYQRKSLTTLIIAQILYLGWIIWGLSSGHFRIDPVPEIFGRLSWMQKFSLGAVTMLMSLYCRVLFGTMQGNKQTSLQKSNQLNHP